MTFFAQLRRGRGPWFRRLKTAANHLLCIHLPVVPATKPLVSSLYHLHVALRETFISLRRFFWFEPLFRSQCVAVGKMFRMEQLPYIVGQGRIVIGDRVRFSGKPSLLFGNRPCESPRIAFGDGTFIGHDCTFVVAAEVRIGSDCLLAGRVQVWTCDGHPLDAAQRRAGLPTPAQQIGEVHIGNDVWIGQGAIVLKGVTIGDRSVVGAGAVVTKDVPADVVVAGNPARIVKHLEPGTCRREASLEEAIHA